MSWNILAELLLDVQIQASLTNTLHPPSINFRLVPTCVGATAGPATAPGLAEPVPLCCAETAAGRVVTSLYSVDILLAILAFELCDGEQQSRGRSE
jgi:hypothetical protein